MVSFGEKAKIKKVGNLDYGRSYVITTVAMMKYSDPFFLRQPYNLVIFFMLISGFHNGRIMLSISSPCKYDLERSG